MATFEKTAFGTVKHIDNNSIVRIFKSNLNVLPHPSSENIIVLSENANSARYNEYAYTFDWATITNPSEASSRTELIELLVKDFFNITDYSTDIALNKYTGKIPVSKFGENPDIDTATAPEDIWDGGGTYTFSSTNDIDRLSSSDNSDTQDIEIQGLDINYNIVVQTITLTGQTPVSLTTPLLRIFRMKNEGSTNIAGNIYCFVNSSTTLGIPDDASKIRAIIRNGNNQTLMMIYTVPAGKNLLYTQGFIALSRQQLSVSADFTLRTKQPGGVFQVKRRISLNSGASSYWLADYTIPRIITEKTDIVFTCEAVSDNNVGVAGGFEGYLEDN